MVNRGMWKGLPRKKPKVRIRVRRPGAMRRVAERLGIKSTATMTRAQARRLGRALARKYGERRARGMAVAPIVWRRRLPDGYKRRMRWVIEGIVGIREEE
jgi:hypothetical protein